MAQVLLAQSGACATGSFRKMPSDAESDDATAMTIRAKQQQSANVDKSNPILDKHHQQRSSSVEQASSPPSSRSTSRTSVASWHEHVYAAPPRTPTPHRISDILGWTDNRVTGRMQGKLLAPTPRRFTSGSPLVRAPLPIYSPLPAHSPAHIHTVSIHNFTDN